jgi:hypothetical protein
MSNGVKIHYHTAGEGPLLIMIHGVGGFWFDWRHQIPTLSQQYKVVIMTQRGFNLSDKPVGVEQYHVAKIAEDIDALIKHFGGKATLMAYDSKVDGIITFGSYHPATVVREFANNPRQQKNAEYARNYQQLPDAAERMAKARLDPNAPMRAGDTPEIHRMRLECRRRQSEQLPEGQSSGARRLRTRGQSGRRRRVERFVEVGRPGADADRGPGNRPQSAMGGA